MSISYNYKYLKDIHAASTISMYLVYAFQVS